MFHLKNIFFKYCFSIALIKEQDYKNFISLNPIRTFFLSSCFLGLDLEKGEK